LELAHGDVLLSYTVHAIYQPIILWTIPFVLFLTSGGYLDVVMNAFAIGFIATMDSLSNPVNFVNFANKAGRQNRLRLFDGGPAEPSSAATQGSVSSIPGAFSGASTPVYDELVSGGGGSML
jgi:hypothetical protein